MLRVNSSKHINGKNSTITIGKTWPKTERENISKISQQGFPGGTVRIHMPMQGTRVQSLVQEDPTCHGATKSMECNH